MKNVYFTSCLKNDVFPKNLRLKTKNSVSAQQGFGKCKWIKVECKIIYKGIKLNRNCYYTISVIILYEGGARELWLKIRSLILKGWAKLPYSLKSEYPSEIHSFRWDVYIFSCLVCTDLWKLLLFTHAPTNNVSQVAVQNL